MDIKEGTYTYTGSGGRKYHVPTELVSSLSQLQDGEHIAIEGKCACYWHHAIVEDVDTKGGTIKTIEYFNSAKGFLEDTLNRSKDAGKAQVIRGEYRLEDGLYLIKHDKCLSAEDVVKRARSRLGENEYNVFYNNCEHFAMWCKTGISSSEQVEYFKDVMKDGAVSLAANLGTQAAAKAGEVIVETAVREVTKKFVSETVVQEIVKSGETTKQMFTHTTLVTRETTRTVTQTSKTPQTSKMGAVAYAAVAEGAFALYDIYNANEDLKAGNITQDEFNDAVGARIVGGVGRVAGSSTGAIVGQFLIPVPVLGGIAGMVGGWIGARVGRCGGGALWDAFK